MADHPLRSPSRAQYGTSRTQTTYAESVRTHSMEYAVDRAKRQETNVLYVSMVVLARRAEGASCWMDGWWRGQGWQGARRLAVRGIERRVRACVGSLQCHEHKRSKQLRYGGDASIRRVLVQHTVLSLTVHDARARAQ